MSGVPRGFGFITYDLDAADPCGFVYIDGNTFTMGEAGFRAHVAYLKAKNATFQITRPRAIKADGRAEF